MRIIAPLAVAATALFATGIAVASTRHVMTLPLNDGSIVRVEYEGDVAPRISYAPVVRPASAPVAIVDPFAQMDAVFAAMEQRHQAMMREIAALQAQAQVDPSSPVRQISAGDGAPAGGGYSFVSTTTTTTSSGGCGHSVEVVQRPGAAPQRIERSFGDCGRAGAAPAPPAPAAPQAPATPTI
jgi:hypothetical protein